MSDVIDKPDVMEIGRHRWHNIIQQLTSVTAKVFNGRAQPCPSCGGKDRFQYHNTEGNGTYSCRGCGGGNGLDLLAKVLGSDHKEAAKRVFQAFGDAQPLAAPTTRRARPQQGEERHKALKAMLSEKTRPLEPGDPAGCYLGGRGIGANALQAFPKVLRYHPRCPIDKWHHKDAMLAIVSDASGRGVSVHRTFLEIGGVKADMERPKRMWPGDLPDVVACRLFDLDDRKVLGIAEGIETALAAHCLFGIPVWSTLNSTLMAKWAPPDDIEKLYVFGDSDKKFGGEKAAFELAHRIACHKSTEHIDVQVRIPTIRGTDWADEWLDLFAAGQMEPAWKTGKGMT